MGSTESIGALHIDLPSPNYQSGDTVTGSIHLLLRQATIASSLLLQLKGTERTEWSATRKKKKRRRTVTFTGKRRAVRQRFEVYRFENAAVAAGQYSFPFALELPQSVKSSFAYTPPYLPILEAGRILATISYTLVAKLDHCSDRIEKGVCPILITRPMADGTSPYSEQRTARISTWFCCAKGAMQVKVTFDKTAFTPGETASVLLEVNNEESQLSVSGFRLTLSRTIRMRSDSGQTHTETATINTSHIDSVIAPGRLLSNAATEVRIVIPTDQSVENATSVSAGLIECAYVLKAEAVMDGNCMCCGELPSVEKAVAIYPPQIERSAAPSVEGGWNPTVLPARHCSAGPDNEYLSSDSKFEVRIQ